MRLKIGVFFLNLKVVSIVNKSGTIFGRFASNSNFKQNCYNFLYKNLGTDHLFSFLQKGDMKYNLPKFYRWNFARAIGALDGKHIRIRKPGKGTTYYNYKKFCSIILMAMVDADYKFMFIDVGAEGSCSDGGVFTNCDFMMVSFYKYLGSIEQYIYVFFSGTIPNRYPSYL